MTSPIYHAFDPLTVDDVVIGHEKLSNMAHELHPLAMQHYNETETAYIDSPCDPDYARYIESEKEGQFVVFTVRLLDEEMIGHLCYYVFRDMHSRGHFTAHEDAWFLTKKHRGGGIASHLLAYAEDCLKQLGCSRVGMSSKAPCGGPDIGPFLERKGYRPVATFYFKQLEAKTNVLSKPAAAA